MPSPIKPFSTRIAIVVGLIALVATIIAGVHWGSRHTTRRPNRAPAPRVTSTTVMTTLPKHASMTNAPESPGTRAGVLPNWPGFQRRPFPVTFQTADFQWTFEDGKDTNVIRKLAHNRLEYARMVEENPRIFRRQLVYLNVTAASVFEQAKLSGQPVQQLTLPGLDGQELAFKIVRREGNGSSRQGMFSGHLVGNPDSMVTLAFQDGREGFTIISPKDNIYVVGEPREDGQVIVKAIDPNTYGLGPEDASDAIKPDSTRK